MKRLRVLIITHMYPRKHSKRSGLLVCRPIEYLARHGIECQLLIPKIWAPWPFYLRAKWRRYGPDNILVGPDNIVAKSIPYFRLPGSWFHRFSGPFVDWALRPEARKWHRAEPFDVVLAFSMFPGVEAAVSIGKALNLPVAALGVGSDIMIYPDKYPSWRKKLAATLGDIDLPLGMSKMLCTRMAEIGSCAREPLCTYLAVPKTFLPAKDKTKILQSLGWPQDAVVAVYVGLVADTKGMDELARVAPGLLVKYPRFKLVCVGGGPAKEKLAQAGAKVGREGAIVLPGEVLPEAVPQFLQAADFLVFPSHSEGLPLALVEAMSCGLPTVATKVGGIPEAVIDGKTGILIDAKNSSQLQAAMERMINDDQFRQAAGRRALAYVKDVFDPDKNAQRFADALWSLAGKNR